MKTKRLAYHLKFFVKEMKLMLLSPFFLLLTLFGNGLIAISSVIFYQIERGVNPKLESYVDALWWTFSTATTTGYGDITPVTSFGKILGVLLMLVGLALFAMYTALFAEIMLAAKDIIEKESD